MTGVAPPPAGALVLRTRSRAPYAIVHVGAHGRCPGACISGYAHTLAVGLTRARQAGARYDVLPILDGRITVRLAAPPPLPPAPPGVLCFCPAAPPLTPLFGDGPATPGHYHVAGVRRSGSVR